MINKKHYTDLASYLQFLDFYLVVFLLWYMI